MIETGAYKEFKDIYLMEIKEEFFNQYYEEYREMVLSTLKTMNHEDPLGFKEREWIYNSILTRIRRDGGVFLEVSYEDIKKELELLEKIEEKIREGPDWATMDHDGITECAIEVLKLIRNYDLNNK